MFVLTERRANCTSFRTLNLSTKNIPWIFRGKGGEVRYTVKILSVFYNQPDFCGIKILNKTLRALLCNNEQLINKTARYNNLSDFFRKQVHFHLVLLDTENKKYFIEHCTQMVYDLNKIYLSKN